MSERAMESTRKRGLSAGLVVLALLMAPPLVAQQDEKGEAQELPSAREVIERYVEAVGGEKAIRRHTSYEMTGRFEMPAAGLSGAMKVYGMAPNKTLAVIEVPGMGTIREGFDGKVGWTSDPAQGPQLKEGKLLTQAEFGAEFYSTLHSERLYKSMETVARTDFEGATCYKLALVTRDGDERTEYYDVESGLLVGAEATIETPMGALNARSIIGNYREFDGVRLSTKLEQAMGPGLKQIINISELEVNRVDPAVFDLPAEIRALLEPPPAAEKAGGDGKED